MNKIGSACACRFATSQFPLLFATEVACSCLSLFVLNIETFDDVPTTSPFTCLLPTHLRNPKVVTLGFLPCDTNVAGDRTTHFPVETIIQDDRKILVVQCPGVTIHDIRVEYDGHSHGKLQIERKGGLGVENFRWEWKIHFDTHHEFVQSDTRRPKSWGVATRDLPLAHVKRCFGGLLAIHPLTRQFV